MIVMGVGLRPTGKLLDEPPNPTTERAPHFYPDWCGGDPACEAYTGGLQAV